MDIHIWAYVIAIVCLLAFSAYFSATETAYTSLNKIRIKNLAGSGNKKAQKVLELSEKYDVLLSTVLIGNNIVNICMAALATVLFVDLYGKYGATLSTIAVTIVVLIFGEISPKSLAKEAPERFAMYFVDFTKLLTVVLRPLTFIFGHLQNGVIKLFKISPNKGFTDEELLTIIEEAETEGNIDEERSELIQNAIEFNSMQAFDVMTPRVDVIAIDMDTTKSEIEKLFKTTGFSRIPVYMDEIDNIQGVLNQKDFHNYIAANDIGIESFVKPVVFAQGSMKLPILLKKMQDRKTHIAVIIDEYGGMDGIVTLEDVIEELVGEIYDEHDSNTTPDIVETTKGTYKVQASTNLEKFFDFFGVEPELDAVTVNGWVVRELNRLPKLSDHFEYVYEDKKFRVRVTKADSRKALEILVNVENIEEK